jgi:hypothetical protein
VRNCKLLKTLATYQERERYAVPKIWLLENLAGKLGWKMERTGGHCSPKTRNPTDSNAARKNLIKRTGFVHNFTGQLN